MPNRRSIPTRPDRAHRAIRDVSGIPGHAARPRNELAEGRAVERGARGLLNVNTRTRRRLDRSRSGPPARRALPAPSLLRDLVPRTVTAAGDDRSRPLTAFRDVAAFVLLGDPGAGKTTEFQREAAALGAGALLRSAYDFLTFAENRRAEWSGKTLFIDGLDEVRAGNGDPRTPLNEIRRQLDALGRPRFRLSCRAADWLGTGDRGELHAEAGQLHAVAGTAGASSTLRPPSSTL